MIAGVADGDGVCEGVDVCDGVGDGDGDGSWRKSGCSVLVTFASGVTTKSDGQPPSGVVDARRLARLGAVPPRKPKLFTSVKASDTAAPAAGMAVALP